MGLDLNSELMEVIRAQTETTSNPLLQTLLTRSNSSTGNNSLPSAQELFSQLESSDPKLALLVKYLVTHSETNTAVNAAESIEIEGSSEEQSAVFEQTQRLAQIVQRLQLQVQKRRVELEQLRGKNDILAAALGACYLCWGEDHDCPVCHGNGQPGSHLPEEHLFAQYVMPALRVMQSGQKATEDLAKKTPISSTLLDVNS